MRTVVDGVSWYVTLHSQRIDSLVPKYDSNVETENLVYSLQHFKPIIAEDNLLYNNLFNNRE